MKRGSRFSWLACPYSLKSSERLETSIAHASSARWLVEVGRQAAVQQELGQTDRDGRCRSQAIDELVRRRSSSAGGHDSVDQPPGGGVGSRDLLAQHEHLAGPGHTGRDAG